MSADNGIYIGHFTDGIRVIQAGAIENCDDSPDYPKSIIDAYRVLYYGGSKVYASVEEANIEANRLFDIWNNEIGICEYGIVDINYEEPFPTMSIEEANNILKDRWSK